MMQAQEQQNSPNTLLRMTAGFVMTSLIIVALYLGQDIFIPLALSILLAFLLEPLVSRLKHWGLPQGSSIAVVVLCAVVFLAVLSTYFVYQLSMLSQELPKYQDTIQHKLQAVKGYASGPSVWDGAVSTFDTVQKSMSEANKVTVEQGVQNVKIVAQENSVMQSALIWGGKVLSPIATAGIVFLFVVLILINRQDLHDRLLKLLGADLNLGTDVLDEAATRISTYLRMQLLVNVSYGVPMALCLWLIGVPAAFMWGLVAVVMRFIPYVGPLLCAIFPITLAFAVDPTWNMVLWCIGLIVVLELVSNNIIEPWLYGESTGLSTLSIILAATFWTLLWGPIGLILATPITACLLVLAHYVPALGFFKIILGSDPVLTDAQRFYQRLVADDVEDALEVAVDFIQTPKQKKPNNELIARQVNLFYQDVAMPALRLFSEQHNQIANAEHRLRLQKGLKVFNYQLQNKYPSEEDTEPQVLCFGARWEIDVMTASMLAHGLKLRRIAAQSHLDSLIQPQGEGLNQIPASVQLICISCFHAQPAAQIRLIQQHFSQQYPQIHLIFATWSNDSSELREAMKKRFAVDVVSSVNELLLSVDMYLMQHGDNPACELVNEQEPQRLQALHELKLLDPEILPIYQQYIEEARQAFDVKYAQISLVDAEWVNIPASSLMAENQNPIEAKILRQESICSHLVYQNQELVIEDISRDPRFANNPQLSKNKINFYAGVPLRDQQGMVLGSLCILDRQVRQASEDDILLLKALADDLVHTLSNENLKQQKLAEIERLKQAQGVHELP